ncbi:unnamed protein product, partial [Amoebophrya sp. A25]
QQVNLREDFAKHSKLDKIKKLLPVLSPSDLHEFISEFRDADDPDPSFELTVDNCQKLLAMHVRFFCGNPVCLFGETGIGKTRLVVYYAKLCAALYRITVVKVHGGTDIADVEQAVIEGSRMAKQNFEDKNIKTTVLFFDECNTSYAALWLCQELMCDGTFGGREVHAMKEFGLKVAIACNPYRRHSAELIARMAKSGLGTNNIPIRHLVYRVHPLPPSLRVHIYDFGSLSEESEASYIRLLVERGLEKIGGVNPSRLAIVAGASDGEARDSDSQPAWLCDAIDTRRLTKDFTTILRKCQNFMKSSKTEKSFVSLRDVERFLHVFDFFSHQLESKALGDLVLTQGLSKTDRGRQQLRIALVCALGVCYYLALAPLSRRAFLKLVEKLAQSGKLDGGEFRCLIFETTLTKVMGVFMSELFLSSSLDTNKNIAQNTALSENVFLMTICAELRIPLFIVGKPGTSKSLARSLVDDAMKGKSSQSVLFRTLKQCVQVSYQCSPLSTSEGILKVFRDCARRQRGKELSDSVAVAVLDEVGLAEFSDTMALKTLHPLLETGCSPDGSFDNVEDYYKVGFYGISNWSLDPAKMNRGILVSRDEPDEAELQETGAKILGVNANDRMLEKIVTTYSEVYKKQGQPEIHGLRDFYCLLKMIGAEVGKRKWIAAAAVSERLLSSANGGNSPSAPAAVGHTEHKCSVKVLDMLLDNLQHSDPDGADPVRYPLIVARKGFASLDVLQESHILDCNGNKNYEILFGSSFANDHEYTNICRAINRVKLCLEKGVVCVLVNLGMIYESIYDALNQYYTCCGGNKYVDLGLGTNRFKCRVHSDARLVIVATKEEILRDFPVPLINRLEKHEVSMELA